MPQRIAIVGSGLAGSSAALALCQVGHTVHLFEAGPTLASGASGNWVGALHPHVGRKPSILSELTALGFEHSIAALEALTAQGLLRKGLDWDTPGHVQIIHPNKAQAAQEALAQGYAGGHQTTGSQTGSPWPPSLVRWSAPGEHIPSPWPGYFFPQGAWVNPKRWVEANVAACGSKLHVHLGQHINPLALQDLQNQFDWVVLACAQHSLALLGLPWQVLRGVAGIVKGQVTRVHLAEWGNGQLATGANGQPARLPYVLSGQTYAICPQQADWMLIGATYEHPEVGAKGDEGEEARGLNAQGHEHGTANLLNTTPPPHAAANAENLRRFKACLPGWPLGPVLDARAAWRFVWHDKLPLVGPVDTQAWAALHERVQKKGDLSKGPGDATAPSTPLDLSRMLLCTAFASRGLSWAGLVGAVLLAYVEEDTVAKPLQGSIALKNPLLAGLSLHGGRC